MVDFEALQIALDDAKREDAEATAALESLNGISQQLTQIQQQVDDAKVLAEKEKTERSAALQKIIDLVQDDTE